MSSGYALYPTANTCFFGETTHAPTCNRIIINYNVNSELIGNVMLCYDALLDIKFVRNCFGEILTMCTYHPQFFKILIH